VNKQIGVTLEIQFVYRKSCVKAKRKQKKTQCQRLSTVICFASDALILFAFFTVAQVHFGVLLITMQLQQQSSIAPTTTTTECPIYFTPTIIFVFLFQYDRPACIAISFSSTWSSH